MASGVQELLARAAGGQLDLARFCKATGETEEAMAERFLKARKNKVDDAYKLLAADIKWREENNIDLITKKSAAEVAGIDQDTLWKYFPAWHQGFDKTGRPILYTAYGNCEVDTLCNLGATVESLLMYYVFQQETAVKLLKGQSELMNRKVSDFYCIVDAKGWGLRLWTRKAMKFIKGMADLSNVHYPERMGCCFIINCPRALVLTCKVIMSWTPKETQEKIKLMGGPEEWQPLFNAGISPDQLCSLYGGQMPPPFDISKMKGVGKEGMPFTQVHVSARSDFKLPIKIEEEGSFLTWAYMTESHDIKFGVFFAAPGETPAVGKNEVIALAKHQAAGNEVQDTLPSCKAGTYLLVWDNSYSYMTSKHLSYRIETGIVDNAAEMSLANTDLGLVSP